MKTDLVKIGTRVTSEQKRRLEDLAVTWGFNTAYNLLKYLIYCFLAACNHTDGEGEIPLEIIKIFSKRYESDAKDIAQAVRNIRSRRKWKRQKRRQRHPPKRRDHIKSDIKDMFDECEQNGRRLQWRPDINKRL